jgi:antagonist of KipI
MSLIITRQGILDTIQDGGRFGYQHLGIGPCGAMDLYSAGLANALLGKEAYAPVIEFHFPAPEIHFTRDVMICLTGANFQPRINGRYIPLNQPVYVVKSSTLQFTSNLSGARAYLSLFPEMRLQPWLSSYSTDLKAGAGGIGRALKKGDCIELEAFDFNKTNTLVQPHWKAPERPTSFRDMHFIPGPEWDWLEKKEQTLFLNERFTITTSGDRMGYRLQGLPLKISRSSMLSSATAFGTVQLFPDGQLVILMADHQTTGGYPRVAQIISSSLGVLAQKKPHEQIKFTITGLDTAHEKMMERKKFLEQLKNTCKFKLEKFLNDSV